MVMNAGAKLDMLAAAVYSEPRMKEHLDTISKRKPNMKGEKNGETGNEGETLLHVLVLLHPSHSNAAQVQRRAFEFSRQIKHMVSGEWVESSQDIGGKYHRSTGPWPVQNLLQNPVTI